jgi:antitoxin HigA-1
MFAALNKYCNASSYDAKSRFTVADFSGRWPASIISTLARCTSKRGQTHFSNEIGVSLNELGRALRVPMNRISAIVNGKRAITVDTAMRLARYFGTSPQYWLNLQIAYDLEVAAQATRSKIEREVLPRTAA